MLYTELDFKISPLQPATEILIAELSELDFESFVENSQGLKAYVPTDLFEESQVAQLFVMNSPEFNISYQVNQMADVNWNAKWESDYEAVIIENRCHIRAPFHSSIPEMEYEIEIEPKMSFGTAHHETTYQMIHLLLDEELSGKKVLDMGCGTAVLAILAKLKNAQDVHAIDNDEWAYNNSLENVKKNHFEDILVQQGDATFLTGQKYDLILANINKNILLKDMQTYAQSLEKNGQIFFSGFYTEDLQDIKNQAEKYGLTYQRHIYKNNWVAAVFATL
ncbi:MAG: 50S ribosomal protein L11 methyltransferase [Bacteroidetes bacterium 4572_77]|nr:MAG: 50S ribosomal protein L11 methyltransferase [Bacteroidetes bacterium 4572_77]